METSACDAARKVGRFTILMISPSQFKAYYIGACANVENYLKNNLFIGKNIPEALIRIICLCTLCASYFYLFFI